MARQILLIEPNKLLSKTYKQFLEANDNQVAVAADAQQAILAIDEFLPDAIVLELQLAGHSGIEFLYELRSYSDLTKIPVIVHTVVPLKTLSSGHEVLDKLGVKGYLYKPQTSLDDLRRAIEKISLKILAS